MAALDFKEIPEAHKGNARDSFELFAREFLHYEGFVIIENPDRGPDGGKDLVVEELRTGAGGETRIRWLVSCKHKAHSGKSVVVTDEQDILDRVRTNECQGFLPFYSTVPSSGLAKKLIPCEDYECNLYDNEKIERHLLRSITGRKLAKRFFPNSIERWDNNNPEPVRLFSDAPELDCMHCGKSLLQDKNHGIVVAWIYYDFDAEPYKEKVADMYFCCKGNCDAVLEYEYSRRNPECISEWEDLPDLKNPTLYYRWFISHINELRIGVLYTDSAFENNKKLLLNLYPHICRQLTDREKERIQDYMEIPSYLGGLGP